jgi:alkylglycerol monooxygenase
MQETVITWATPAFFALIAIELLWSLRARRTVYRLDDAITSIGLGALSQVAGVFMRLLRVGIYVLLFQAFALARWPTDAWWSLPLALVFYDFCYYWHHRWMHEIGAAWAAHVVHHSSEDYNLSTALRQTATGPLLGWIPYVPMAVAGVPPTLFAAVGLINLLYQFWIHTELVGRLGWFDRVFASPSNHRVHHAVNDAYIDRNYGGVLILWDRIFGTFQDERADDPPVYGTRAPLRSFDPLRANLEVYASLAATSRAARRWRDKLQVWVRRPGWRPADGSAGTAAPFVPGARRRFAPGAGRAARVYAVLQFAVVLAASVHFLQIHARTPTVELLGYLAWVMLSLSGIGRVLARERGGWAIEVARHLAVATALPLAGRWFAGEALPSWALALAAAAAIASAVAAWRIGTAERRAHAAADGVPDETARAA